MERQRALRATLAAIAWIAVVYGVHYTRLAGSLLEALPLGERLARIFGTGG